MTHEEFNQIVRQKTDEIRDVLITKAGEYAPDEDRLVQFKRAANLLHISPFEALMGMMVKHTTSIYMMSQDPYTYKLEKWWEKLLDHCAYCLLAYALLKEENESILSSDKKE